MSPAKSVLALIFVLINHVVSDPEVSPKCETCHNQPNLPTYGVQPPPAPPQGYPIYGAPPPPLPISPPGVTCPPGQAASCCRVAPPPPVPLGYGPPSQFPVGYGPPNPYGYVPVDSRSASFSDLFFSSFPSLFLCVIMVLLLLLVDVK